MLSSRIRRTGRLVRRFDDRTEQTMTQNIYDNETFFAGYSLLPRSIEGLEGAAEWPALRALLPELRGLRVLDLGCGFGWFCRWAREHGAASVLGIDISDRMLARARAETRDASISYAKADRSISTCLPCRSTWFTARWRSTIWKTLKGCWRAYRPPLFRAAA
jgi:2-polyprenyl-3-methyl-5-hydroxy-6-metoxy-1,4-benzoquinol methylase